MSATPPNAPVPSYLEPAGEASARAQRLAAVAVVLALLAIVAGVVADALAAPPPVQPAAEPVAQGPATAGVWYCPAVAAEDETAVVSIEAVGDATATATLVRYDDATPVPDEPVEVEPGEAVEVPLAAGEADTPVAVRWEGSPVTVAWRLEATDVAGAACAAAPSEQWHVAGLATAGGAQSRLHLFNPFTVDAVVRVVFGTAEGRVALVLTDNVVVEAGTSRVVDLGEFQPEEPDLAVSVEVLAGRIVAAGDLEYAPEGQQTGPSGRTLVPGATETGDDWAFAWAQADDDTVSHLSIYNPSDREAAVSLQLTDANPDGPGLAEQSVPAGGLIRIDLAEASTSGGFSVRVRTVTDVEVVVARVTAFDGDGEALAASLGSAPSASAAVPGLGAGDRAGAIGLYNPGGEPVEVAVEVGEGQPAEWGSVTLEPNQRLSLPIAELGDRAAFPVVVTATGPVVAEALSAVRGEDELQAWTSGAIDAGVWEGPPTRPEVRRDRTLTTSPIPVDEPTAPDLDLDAPSPFEPDAGATPEPTAPPVTDDATEPDDAATEEPTEPGEADTEAPDDDAPPGAA